MRESAENYLEAIYVIEQRKGSVRSVEIAAELGFSKPSVSIALKQLRESGYVSLDQDGAILLTEKGKEVALRVYERHTVLSNLLVLLGVSPETAKQDACLLEHDLSDESFERIKEFWQKNRKSNPEDNR